MANNIKTCDGCRAFNGAGNGCSLNHETNTYWIKAKMFTNVEVPKQKPAEKCEKPRTYSKYMKLVTQRNNKR